MNRIIEFVLGLAIVGTALAFGGVQEPAYLVAVAVVVVAAFLLFFNQTRKGRIQIPLPVWPALFMLWAVLAVIPLPSWLVEILSPARLAGLGVPALGQASGWATLSVDPHQTALALGKLLAYLLAFVLAAYFFDSWKGKSTLLRILIVLGCFEAAYGIFEYLTGRQKIFTYAKVYDLAEATGTYINRNHFAGMLELILPFVLALAFYSFQKSSGFPDAHGRRHSSRGRGSVNSQAVFYLFLMALLGVALVFSRSRTGILSAAVSLFFIVLLGQVKTRQKGWTLLVVLFLTVVVGYGLWIGMGPVLARFEKMREKNYLEVEGRVKIWKDTARLVRDYPLTGTGLGTYGTAFRHYQTEYVDRYAEHAHNDYLEFASETGAVGLALLFLPIGYLLIRMVVAFLNDSHRYRRSILLGCIGATLALLIHSVSDFNLQIPANALIFAVVLGIGYKAACLEPREKERPVVPVPSRSPGIAVLN